MPVGGHQHAAIRCTGVTEYVIGTVVSVRFNARELDHLAPLLGFVSEQPPKVGGRESEHVATENGKLGLHFGIGQR